MKEKLLKGRLYLYSEQGMEGGCLAIQDLNFINLTDSRFGVTENKKVWDKNDIKRFGITSNPEIYLNDSWLVWPDPITKEPDYLISSLYRGEEKGDFNADKRLMEKYNFRIKYIEEKANDEYGEGNWKFTKPNSEIVLNDGSVIMMGVIPNCVPERPYGIPENGLTRVTVTWNDGIIEPVRLSNTLLLEEYSYEGLHMLKETDFLKVIDHNTNDTICEGQLNQIPLRLFSQTIKGHFEQVNQNVDELSNWGKYFSEQYTAELYREMPIKTRSKKGFIAKIESWFL